MSERTSEPLRGRVALVTGGSRGIGAAIARRLGALGAGIAISHARSAAQAEAVVDALRAAGREAEAFVADAADAQAMAGLVERVVERFGRIDVLVNNAGVAVVAPVDEMEPAEFDRVFAVNVRAPFLLARAAARRMAPGGRIVNIGSVNADRMPMPGLSTYGASKAALRGLTQGWARDLAPRGITVNTVQPGPIDTEMNPASGPFSEAIRAFLPIGRYGTADEVAALVGFLATPEAAYITGAHIDVAGGFGI